MQFGVAQEFIELMVPDERMHGKQRMRMGHRRRQAKGFDARPQRRQGRLGVGTRMIKIAWHCQPAQHEGTLKFGAVSGERIGIETELGTCGGIKRMIKERAKPIVVQQARVPVRQSGACRCVVRGAEFGEPAFALGFADMPMFGCDAALFGEGCESLGRCRRETLCEASQDVLDRVERLQAPTVIPHERRSGAAPRLHEGGCGDWYPQDAGVEMAHFEPRVARVAMGERGRQTVACTHGRSAYALAHILP